MNEKTRTSRIRQELERAKAELARQDHEVAALSADIDPAELAEAEATFAKILRQSSREEETPKQALVIPTYALRV